MDIASLRPFADSISVPERDRHIYNLTGIFFSAMNFFTSPTV